MLSRNRMNAAERKRQLRGWALATRDALSPERRARASSAAARHLLAHDVARPAAKTAAFAPIRAEADVSLLFDRPYLAFPRVGPTGLHLHWSRPEQLVPRPPFGIPEPTPDMAVAELDAIDLVVVPGLVFDARGGRIGYGKGYYDRLIERLRSRAPAVRCVGFAFEAQVVDAVPGEPFDQPLDGLVTEAGLRWFSVEPTPSDG